MDSAFAKYVIRRTLWLVPVAAITTVFIFSLIHVMPGDPASVLLPPEAATQANIELVRQEYGLDKPLHVQYWTWVWGLLHGDMGTSFVENRPVFDILMIGVRRSLLLGFWAAILGIVVAVPLGMLAAVYKDTWIDDLSRFAGIGGISVPEFWLALMLILVFSQMWSLTFGSPLIPPSGYKPLSEGVVDWAHHSVGPAFVLAVPYGAILMRIARSSMADELNKDYITTAQSKGLKERTIIRTHALKNALIPVVTVGAYQGGTILNGSVLVETVFAYPGIGWYIYRAAIFRDFPMVMGAMVILVFIFVGVNFAADITYAWIDPRIGYEEGAS